MPQTKPSYFARYNFDMCEVFLLIFSRNVTEKVSCRKTLYFKLFPSLNNASAAPGITENLKIAYFYLNSAYCFSK